MTLRSCAALILTCILGITVPSFASAQPELNDFDIPSLEEETQEILEPGLGYGNLVMFGDSITANPKVSQMVEEGTTCAQDPNNLTRQVANNLGLEARDLSCSGAGVASQGFGNGLLAKAPGLKSFESQVNKAISSHQLDADTKVVLIMIGFNDTYNIPLNVLDPATQVRANLKYPQSAGYSPIKNTMDIQHLNWDDSMNDNIPRIQKAAPNAKIVFSGYPAIADESGLLCLVHVGGIPVVPAWLPQIDAGLNNVNSWSYDAAQRFGSLYVDLRTPTLPNNMCAPDPDRNIPGLIDTTTVKPWNLPVHPTARGVEKSAEIISEEIRAHSAV